jgi:WD40 repeat protein
MQFVNCCRWAPDGSAILSGSSDKTLRCWRLLRDGNPDFAHFQWGNGTVLNFAFAHCNSSMQDDHQDSADYQRLTLKHRTHLPDMKCILTTLVGHQGSITSCEFSPDMRWIASTSTDLTTRIWDTQQSLDPKTADEALRLRLTGHQKSVISCAFSPRSDVIATGSQDSTVRISRVEDGLLCESLAAATPALCNQRLKFNTGMSALVGCGRECVCGERERPAGAICDPGACRLNGV